MREREELSSAREYGEVCQPVSHKREREREREGRGKECEARKARELPLEK